LQVSHRGVFEVSATYSCNPGAEGSEFLVEVNAQKLIGTSKATRSWAEYTTESLGQVRFDQPGTLALSVKPKIDKAPWKVIGLKSVILTPVGNGEKGSP
jgi:hypothetical protein